MQLILSKLTLLVVMMTLAAPSMAVGFIRLPSIQGEATEHTVKRVEWLNSSRGPIVGQPGRVAVLVAEAFAGDAAKYKGAKAQLVVRHRTQKDDGSAPYMIIELQNAQITSFQLGALDSRVVLSYQSIIERPAR